MVLALGNLRRIRFDRNSPRPKAVFVNLGIDITNDRQRARRNGAEALTKPISRDEWKLPGRLVVEDHRTPFRSCLPEDKLSLVRRIETKGISEKPG